MAIGPGKYDDLCTHVRVEARAEGVVVIVFNGRLGSGFAVQAPLEITSGLPEVLRRMATDIENSYVER